MSTEDTVSEVSDPLGSPELGTQVGVIDSDEGELDLIDLVREQLGLDDDISDMTIASSLAAIAARADAADRLSVAATSPLGKRLASRGSDMGTALESLVSLAQTKLN